MSLSKIKIISIFYTLTYNVINRSKIQKINLFIKSKYT